MTEADAIQQLQQLTKQIGDAKLQVDKIGTETDALIGEIKELQEQAQNETLSPEFEAQLQKVADQADALSQSTQAVDLKVPDQPPPDVPPGASK